jgi:hypothetical protein
MERLTLRDRWIRLVIKNLLRLLKNLSWVPTK